VSVSLEASYAHCREVARARARNFYYSFLLLDPARRDAMCAIYAFMRECDDLSDGPGRTTVEGIARWRADMESALAGRYGESRVWPAFHDAAQRYRIPAQYFHEMIDGVASDLDRARIVTFDELYRYCYQVASVVGLTVIHVLGFQSDEAPALAEKCGVAFQLTNILRDIREDALEGRVYLPAEDLDRFGVAPEDLRTGNSSPEFVRLMQFEAARARSYYTESRPLLDLVDRSGRPMLWALIEIYSRLLQRIERSNFDVLRRRISLPATEKMWIVTRGLIPAWIARG
jgi:15-cis-phytoene synthase